MKKTSKIFLNFESMDLFDAIRAYMHIVLVGPLVSDIICIYMLCGLIYY